MDLKELEILGEGINRHWYYKEKANAVRQLLRGIPFHGVLDVGAGSGFFSKCLLQEESVRAIWCVDTSYDRDWEESVDGRTVHYRQVGARVPANLALFMDVLEHVDDDVGLLRHYIPLVDGASNFLISVPAFQSLWSGHDVFLGHRRRYRLEQIEDVVHRAGLQLVRSGYFFATVFPIAAGLRWSQRLVGRDDVSARSQLKRHHPAVNWLLGSLSHAELPLIGRNRLFGLTAFCVARHA
ncbi:methyltransferase domain-containing protein [Pseudorhodoferax sp. Leaf265]|uniref:methyltransferase domain-containing protein n=1 Tax=Pseudorhodoferax sp. Leaf265 TaxID=1736315 RepID=UPI0006F7B5C9|nr:methyltransferase domain-containing protein [Pseudorhodoferax sp. Leaf265]KQP17268.1 methyltransferase [Pseudorhodoferax sp. Leaf265]